MGVRELFCCCFCFKLFAVYWRNMDNFHSWVAQQGELLFNPGWIETSTVVTPSTGRKCRTKRRPKKCKRRPNKVKKCKRKAKKAKKGKKRSKKTAKKKEEIVQESGQESTDQEKDCKEAEPLSKSRSQAKEGRNDSS